MGGNDSMPRSRPGEGLARTVSAVQAARIRRIAQAPALWRTASGSPISQAVGSPSMQVRNPAVLEAIAQRRPLRLNLGAGRRGSDDTFAVDLVALPASTSSPI
ncbi:MAG TPA: hypothetical protein PKA20_08755 [Burkholderiaceae bacterium]|nr:hypothetical protein [Burkholderiaceae bacterium]